MACSIRRRSSLKHDRIRSVFIPCRPPPGRCAALYLARSTDASSLGFLLHFQNKWLEIGHSFLKDRDGAEEKPRGVAVEAQRQLGPWLHRFPLAVAGFLASATGVKAPSTSLLGSAG